MADGVTLDPGTGGDTIAADDLGATGKAQYVKLMDGTDASGAVIPGDASNGLDVDVTRVQGTVTVDGSGVTQPVSGTVGTELTTADLDTGVGTDTQAVVGLSLAESGGAVQVGSATPLPVDVSSIAAGDNNIGNVDVASSALPTGAATSAKQDTVIGHLDGVEGLLTTIDADTGTIAGAVSGAEMQVDIVSSAAIPVTDNGGALTVDGTVSITGSVDTELTQSDMDTGAGSQFRAVVGLNLAENGGPTIVGSANPMPVSDNGSSLTVDVGTALPTGDNNIGNVDIASALPAGTNAIGKLAANSGVDIGDVDVTSIAAGTNTIGAVNVKPATSGGLTIFRSIDLDETEEEAKATAGQLFGYFIFNAAASTRYVKLYNATAANVTVGTTTPVITIPVPAGSAANVEFTNGIAFSTAITAAATTGVADNDTGAPSANDVIVNLFYA